MISLVITTGTSGDFRTIAAVLSGLSDQGTSFVQDVLLPMYENLSDEAKMDMVTRIERGSSNRTFRDAMSGIAFVYLNT